MSTGERYCEQIVKARSLKQGSVDAGRYIGRDFAQDDAGIAQCWRTEQHPTDAYDREGAHDIDRRSQTSQPRETRRLVKRMPDRPAKRPAINNIP